MRTKYSFPKGIPAFEDIKEFNLVERLDIFPLVLLRGDNVDFIAVPIIPLSIEYKPVAGEDELFFLGAEGQEGLSFYNLLTFGDKIEKTTANLQGPIILNSKTLLGVQVILKKIYPVRYKIWGDLKKYDIPMKIPVIKGIIDP